MQKKKPKRDIVPVDTMKAIWELGGVAPLLLYRDTRQVKCPLYPQPKENTAPIE
jgi:hypothetical protein